MRNTSVWLPEDHFGLFGCRPTPAQFLTDLATRPTGIQLAPATVVVPIKPWRRTRSSTCSAACRATA
jgi:hypothetical protein